MLAWRNSYKTFVGFPAKEHLLYARNLNYEWHPPEDISTVIPRTGLLIPQWRDVGSALSAITKIVPLAA